HADVKFSGNKQLIDKEQYDKIQLSGTTSLSNVKYISKDYPTGIVISKVNSQFTPALINITEFSGNYLQSNFSGNGSLQNAIGYALDKNSLSGTLNASIDKMNLNDWIDTEETTPATS